MFKAALASALVLATVGVGYASADTVNPRDAGAVTNASLTDSHIAQARAALRLTPAQERHWPRVAAALRAFSREQASAGSARRVMAAARPLFRTLDAGQRQTALGMVRSMGFGYLAAGM